jgi:hypothetical protein
VSEKKKERTSLNPIYLSLQKLLHIFSHDLMVDGVVVGDLMMTTMNKKKFKNSFSLSLSSDRLFFNFFSMTIIFIVAKKVKQTDNLLSLSTFIHHRMYQLFLFLQAKNLTTAFGLEKPQQRLSFYCWECPMQMTW